MLAPREVDEYLLPTERRVIRVRKHWAYMLKDVSLTSLVLLAIVIGERLLPDSVLIDNLAWYLALVAVLRFTVHTILWWIERIVITDKRVMLAEGIITHKVGMMPLGKVTDLTFERTLGGRMFGYGTHHRGVGRSDPGAQPDRLPAAPRGDLRGAVRARVRGEGQDARHRDARQAALAPLTSLTRRGLASGVPRHPRIDLHTHSTASDGTDRPAELVAVAAAAGVDVLAITDHDTTAGWAEAAAALRPGMRLLRGAEFSCVSPDRARGDRDCRGAPTRLPVRPGRTRRSWPSRPGCGPSAWSGCTG